MQSLMSRRSYSTLPSLAGLQNREGKRIEQIQNFFVAEFAASVQVGKICDISVDSSVISYEKQGYLLLAASAYKLTEGNSVFSCKISKNDGEELYASSFVSGFG